MKSLTGAKKNQRKKISVFLRESGKCFPSPVPEFIDPVFAKTSPKRSFSMSENQRSELVFAKTGPINSGTGAGAHRKKSQTFKKTVAN
jgi:hypothetical protein